MSVVRGYSEVSKQPSRKREIGEEELLLTTTELPLAFLAKTFPRNSLRFMKDFMTRWCKFAAAASAASAAPRLL